MKVRVNSDSCIGCGACCAICEEVFEINDEGLSQVKVIKDENGNEKEVEITEEITQDCIEAIESCPTGAIEEVTEEAE